ncbi:hypothetical protein AB7M45_007882 [Bradyrhizobium elkanii]|uniref:PD-(D/E)XK nuclease-like domain-containing protein n=1 Tax=Bradyrhizobium elkanii TaxID=29448 RepID=UPI000911DF8A|nr:PD-(D/E)XK nuclease-like domain-containing protein [Bradyrhizobium elkanii]MCW2195111.1 hypothetical protein [Bradyrhizobium elkanii]NWL67199.1 hypothetical protein [Bradyrhizobium elkanii]OIM93211.1 hypothetical protein BLN97_17560 [Bradyrhizobium elkanii]
MNAVVPTADVAASEPVKFEPGIYFGVPEDKYHQDTSLGSTKLKELVIDPIEYQHGRLHGAEQKETFQLKWGRAIHCRALEGKQFLCERFPIAPSLTDYPKALVTMDHLREHAKKLGLTKVGNTKALVATAIREFDQTIPIWDEIMARFETEHAGKTIIPREAIEHIERAVEWMQREPKLAPVMEDGTFTAGASEVSIFYEENGVRLKARIDHLLSHAVVDLKSFRPFLQERLREAAKKAISRMRYDLQAAAYIRALKVAAKLFDEGKVFDCPYSPSFLESVFAALKVAERDPGSEEALKWVWVLIKASGAPQPVVAEFDLGSMIFRQAAVDIDDAIKNYRLYVEKFGLDQDWVPELPAEVWGDTDFPSWAFT